MYNTKTIQSKVYAKEINKIFLLNEKVKNLRCSKFKYKPRKTKQKEIKKKSTF